jgi:hypothetical protein
VADKITIDIEILQGIFGDLNKLQQQLTGVSGSVMAVDRAMNSSGQHIQQALGGVNGAVGSVQHATDSAMRGMVEDMMGPLAKSRELEDKLQRLGSQVRTSKSVKEITALKSEITATQRELDKVNTGGMESKVSGGASRMRSMFSSLVAPLAGAFAVGGIVNFGRGVLDAASDTQKYTTALEVMLGSKDKADQLFQQVKVFAATTPFELPQVEAASQQLLAFGFDSKKIVPQLTVLGNVASALNQPVGDIAYLFGTARVQGRLYTNDLMQFMNRGIPIVTELSKVMGVSEAQVKELTAEGKVGFADLEKAMNNLGGAGGKFDGLMDKQSRTIGGTLSNLSDSWGQFKADLGLSLAPMFMKGISLMGGAVEGLRSGFEWVQANGPVIKGTITGIGIAVGLYSTALLINNAGLIANNALQTIAAIRMGAMAVVTNVVTAATTLWTGAQWLLNAALNANPIGLVVVAIAALVGGVLYAWNHFEGFRAFLFGLWESVKAVFFGIKDIVTTVFGSLVDIVAGFGKTLIGAITLDPAMVKEGILQGAKGIRDAMSITDDIKAIGWKAGAAYAEGDAKGRASYKADNKVAASPGTTNAKAVAPGQDVGAASLLGGSAPGPITAAAGGSTGGGKGSGSGDRNISMNITIHNQFAVGRNSDVDAKSAADKVVGMLVNKLRDAEFAIG